MRAQASDAVRRERFRAVYEANYAAILGYALRRVPADDAADIVAEVFLTAWRRLAHVPEGDAARLWLYTVARHAVANRARSERRRHRLYVRLFQEPQRSLPGGGVDDRGAVASAFERLKASEREVLSLVVWEGLTPTEAAVVLGCSSNAARIRLHRARRKLAAELARESPTAEIEVGPAL